MAEGRLDGEMEAAAPAVVQRPLFEGAPDHKPLPRYTEKAIIEALRRGRGLVTHAARLLGCSPTTIEQRTKTSAAIKAAREELDLAFIDDAEHNIIRAVSAMAPCAACGGSKVEQVRIKGARGRPARYEQRQCGPCNGFGTADGLEPLEIDPVEVRQHSKWVLQTKGRKRGYGDRVDVVRLPTELLEKLSNEQLENAIARINAKEPVNEVIASLLGSM